MVYNIREIMIFSCTCPHHSLHNRYTYQLKLLFKITYKGEVQMQNKLPLISRIFVIFCLFTILTACGKDESNDDELESIKEELTQLKKDKEKERSEKEKEELEQKNKEEIEEAKEEETESASNKNVSEDNSKSNYESDPIIEFVEEGGKKYIFEKGGTGLNDPDT